MALEALAASAAVAGPAALPPSAGGPPATVTAGYGAGLADAQAFQGALAAAGGGPAGPERLPPAIQSVLDQLQHVDSEARSVSTYAKEAAASGNAMTPAEIIQLTMRCHEFMFHCQLSSNVANRTSDGLQQLFRQQS